MNNRLRFAPMLAITVLVLFAVAAVIATPAAAQNDCVLVGTPVTLEDQGYELNFPTLAFDGTHYGVSYAFFDFANPVVGIEFLLIDPSGATVAGPTQLSDPNFDADVPSLTMGQDQYAACWQDFRNDPDPGTDPENWEIYSSLIDLAGLPIGSSIRISDADDWSEESAIAYNPVDDEFAMVWDDLRFSGVGVTEIYLRRIDAMGALLDPEVTVSRGFASSLAPDIAWDGSGYGVVWIDDRNVNEELFFGRVTADGSSYSGDIQLASAHLYQGPTIPPALSSPSICWSGSSFGIAYVDNRTGDDEIYFIQVGLDGSVITPELRVTNDANLSAIPDIVWNGGTFLIGYTDDRFGATSIMVSAISPAGVEIVDDARIVDVSGAVVQLSLLYDNSTLAVAWDDDADGNFRLRLAFIDCSVPTPVRFGSFAATPADPGVDVLWSTVSEVSTLGFQVLSTTAEDAPPVPASPVIPAVGPGHPYRYHDGAGDEALWYKVREITSQGPGDETPLFAVSTGAGRQQLVPQGPRMVDGTPAMILEAAAAATTDGVVLTWNPPAVLDVDAYRVWMRHTPHRRPFPLGTRMRVTPGEPMTFTDGSRPAVTGARQEYQVVAFRGGKSVAVSPWIRNPFLQRGSSGAIKRGRRRASR